MPKDDSEKSKLHRSLLVNQEESSLRGENAF
jgi:hypothetical protein